MSKHDIDDGGLEKKLQDYHREGGSDSQSDAAKSLEGEIAKAHASQDAQLNKALPEQSRTAKR
jgi:hypothetical protein